MKITLGLGLDGLKPKLSPSTIGVKEVGPMGLLAILETQCGIAPMVDSPTTRIIQYLACLKACDHPQRFYHRSFAVDQFNVAKTLLNWRDNWYESAWQGVFTETVTDRLQDMAAVELVAQGKVSLGFGQRQQALLTALNTQKTQIKHIVLIDPLSDFSPLWQQLLQCFTLIEQPVLLAPSESDTDLSRVQTTLAQLASESLAKDENGSITKVKLKGDNSFVVLKARSRANSARLISQWLATQTSEQPKNTIALLSGSEGAELDDALAAVDLPRLGFVKTSPWRPVLQVLPIALELLWEPLNPQVLLQLLMHPMGLLPRRIRYPLAKVVADAPGIGGELWQKTLSSLLENEKTREDYSAESYQQLEADLSYWFASERYTPELGLPLDIAKQRIMKVQTWLAKQQSFESDDVLRSLFGAALSQASELNSALTTLLLADGAHTTQPEQLRYLLDQLTGAGTGIVDQFPEVIPNRLKSLVGANQPDSFTDPVNTVVWWDLQTTSSAASYTWSQQELAQLKEHGVLLANLDQQLQRQALSWLKPINAAKERLVIVLHDSHEAHHPLWDQISSCLEHWQDHRVEDSILDSQAISAFNQLLTVQSPYKPLPGLRRTWQLETGAELGAREQESYSSLENFFYSPYKWVLQYKAKLRAGTLQSLSDGNLLKGKVVHHLYELFFNDNSSVLTADYDKAAVDQWFDKAIKTLLLQEGAVLLQPGRLVEKEQFISTTRKSLHALIQQLRAAKVITVVMEQKQDALFFGGKLSGYIDMKVTNDQGISAVVDIKWGGLKSRKTSLKENKHLQLVTYSYMGHKNTATQEWPTVAYFIIDGGGAMLAQNTEYFPEATAVKPVTEENHAEIWQKMKETWLWRRKQLDSGLIEVTVTGTEVDEDLQAEEGALSIPDSSDYFNDYRVLTGWSV